MTQITVLNECFLSPQNIQTLKSLGTLTVYNDTTTVELAKQRIKNADIVLADMFECPLNADVLSEANNLKLLCLNSTAHHLIDSTTINNRQAITINNVPNFGTHAVAEHTFGLILSSTRQLINAIQALKDKPFEINPSDKAHYQFLGTNLHGKTLGIIGLGAIGQQVATIAKGFSMNIIAYNRSPKNIDGVKQVSLDELLSNSDIVSLNCPLTPDTAGIINAESLAKMKPNALFVNTGAGGCVINTDLANALNTNKIAGAALDKLDSFKPNNPLFSAKNCLITPHMAWFAQEALANIGNIMTANVQAFLNGTPQNVVQN